MGDYCKEKTGILLPTLLLVLATAFWGLSFISDPQGTVLKQASIDQEELLICPVDLSTVQKIRELSSFPFRDRRIDSYSGLTKLYLDSEG